MYVRSSYDAWAMRGAWARGEMQGTAADEVHAMGRGGKVCLRGCFLVSFLFFGSWSFWFLCFRGEGVCRIGFGGVDLVPVAQVGWECCGEVRLFGCFVG